MIAFAFLLGVVLGILVGMGIVVLIAEFSVEEANRIIARKRQE